MTDPLSDGACRLSGPIVSPRTYLRAIHLLAMFLLGIIYFVSLVTAFAVGGALIWTASLPLGAPEPRSGEPARKRLQERTMLRPHGNRTLRPPGGRDGRPIAPARVLCSPRSHR